MVEMRQMDWTDVIGELTELRTRPSMATTLGKKISKRSSGKSVGREVFGVGLNREGAEYKHCGACWEHGRNDWQGGGGTTSRIF
jgi:hypothetical protein